MTTAPTPSGRAPDGRVDDPEHPAAEERAPHSADALRPGERAHALYAQVERAVEILNASLNIAKSRATENLIAYLTLAVFENGRLERVDRVVLEPLSNSIAAVQLLPYQRSHIEVRVATQAATAADSADSMLRLVWAQAHLTQHGRLPHANA